jgi:hypothetical protein
MAQPSKDYVSRDEFMDLKKDVKELHNIYDIVNRQIVVTEKLALEMKYMREDQKETKDRVKCLEEKPTKRFDSLITQIIGNVIALIIGAIAAIIGFKN